MSDDPAVPAGQRPLLLLVDDNADNLALYAQYLTHAGFQVAEARDGKEALDQACQVAPDLIVMDLGLPIMDGWTATRALKSDPQTRAIPVLAITAHIFIGEERARAAGADAYLIKPCLPEDLEGEIRRLLASSTTRRSAAGSSVPATCQRHQDR